MQILDFFLRDLGILTGRIFMQILGLILDHARRNAGLKAVKLQMFGG